MRWSRGAQFAGQNAKLAFFLFTFDDFLLPQLCDIQFRSPASFWAAPPQTYFRNTIPSRTIQPTMAPQTRSMTAKLAHELATPPPSSETRRERLRNAVGTMALCLRHAQAAKLAATSRMSRRSLPRTSDHRDSAHDDDEEETDEERIVAAHVPGTRPQARVMQTAKQRRYVDPPASGVGAAIYPSEPVGDSRLSTVQAKCVSIRHDVLADQIYGSADHLLRRADMYRRRAARSLLSIDQRLKRQRDTISWRHSRALCRPTEAG